MPDRPTETMPRLTLAHGMNDPITRAAAPASAIHPPKGGATARRCATATGGACHTGCDAEMAATGIQETPFHMYRPSADSVDRPAGDATAGARAARPTEGSDPGCGPGGGVATGTQAVPSHQ